MRVPRMAELKSNALGIRITDGELRRLKAIKSRFGYPSMANTTLAHDLLILGMERMEMQTNTESRVPASPPSQGDIV